MEIACSDIYPIEWAENPLRNRLVCFNKSCKSSSKGFWRKIAALLQQLTPNSWTDYKPNTSIVSPPVIII